MKKLLLLLVVLLSVTPVFSQYYGYTSSRRDDWEFFDVILAIIYVVFAIIIIVKFFNIASDIRALRDKYAPKEKEPEQKESPKVDNTSPKSHVIPYRSSTPKDNKNSSNITTDDSVPFEYQGYIDPNKK